jgi:catechol 2,3-dioxygenase-like lactoylglutathione lyase family enzyme
MIGRLEKTVLDCPDPQALAAFYGEILGMRVNQDDGDWQKDPTAPHRSHARGGTLQPGRIPVSDAAEEHLDIRVDDVDAAEQAVLALGASRLSNEHENGFRVFTDPAGHPFCLVFG